MYRSQSHAYSWQLLVIPNPYSFGSDEQRHELVLYMETHHRIGTTDELLADEDCRHARPAPELLQRPLDLLPIRHLIHLVDGRVCPKVVQERLCRVAHAARTLAEDHQWLLIHQSCHHVHR